MKRSSGILLPVFSLPSNYGIGCFSKEAYQMIDFLKGAGQSYWQILPLGPTSFGDSPYQSFSTFAGNPYFIDLETLVQEGLLTVEECQSCDFGQNPQQINYAKLFHQRFSLLYKAFERFHKNDSFYQFLHENQFWLEDYALYMAIKEQQNHQSWVNWPTPLKFRHPEALEEAKNTLRDTISFYSFLQYLFYTQWNRLHSYARERQISIIGDVPIYVAFDSADTWSHPELFWLDEHRNPVCVAGCPPDGFTAKGQLWGNPVYNWDYHKDTHYTWWTSRIRHALTLYDVVRIDHFRGFDSFYAVPYPASDAVHGSWQPGPGMELFHALKESLSSLPIIAEDLGFLTPSVYQLLQDSGFPGMKVLQFAFDSRESSNYLPHTYTPNCVVYTGTHDNDTTKGWYLNTNTYVHSYAKEYLQQDALDYDELPWPFIALALQSVANLAIIPMQDYLGLSSTARINTPSTLGNNWTWRLSANAFSKELQDKIYGLTKLYGRLP